VQYSTSIGVPKKEGGGEMDFGVNYLCS
jgi:hypothetical protein